MIQGERFQALLVARGISQSELARRVGLTQPTIAKLASGGRGSAHIHKIARELGTSPAYLTGETDDPSIGAIPLPTAELMAERLDLVPLEEIDLEYGMGGTFGDSPVTVQVHQVPRLLMEAMAGRGTTSTSLFVAKGRGDSMEPTIADGDMIIVDRSKRQLRDPDRIWALTVGDFHMVKRLRPRGSSIVLLSDNPKVPEEVVSMEEINLVGRVVFVGRNL